MTHTFTERYVTAGSDADIPTVKVMHPQYPAKWATFDHIGGFCVIDTSLDITNPHLDDMREAAIHTSHVFDTWGL